MKLPVSGGMEIIPKEINYEKNGVNYFRTCDFI